MSPKGRDCTSYATFQPLTRQEIDRRIQDVVSEVSVPEERERATGVSADGFRFIEPADFVRRMRPHLVFN